MNVIEDNIKDVFTQAPVGTAIAAVYLMGSAVTGKLRPDSDIDIALLPSAGASLSTKDRLDLAATLSLQTGREMDIGIISDKNLIYASEAILKGKRILTLDEHYVAQAETRLLGCYLQFRLDRREVEGVYHAA